MGAKIEMKAIPTEYNEHTFRSRLEARWAMFLDESNIPWKYEWEGYDLDGYKYLPDFYLPNSDGFLEVKPVEGEWLRQAMLALHTMRPVLVVEGGVVERYATGFKPSEEDGIVTLRKRSWIADPCRQCRKFTLRTREDKRSFCITCGSSGDWIDAVARRVEAHSFWNPPVVPSSTLAPPPNSPQPDNTFRSRWMTEEYPPGSLRDRLRAGMRGGHLQVISGEDASPLQGKCVRHQTFGDGFVESSAQRGPGDWELVVTFPEYGAKRMLQSIANLEEVS